MKKSFTKRMYMTLAVAFIFSIQSFAQRTLTSLGLDDPDTLEIKHGLTSKVTHDTIWAEPERIIQPPNEDDPPILTDEEMNFACGIPYELSVVSGQTTITVPINVQARDFEIGPNLKLIYGNNSGIGYMGRGWSMSGISEIYPITANFFTDDNTHGIGSDTIDVYALDGVRLIRQNENGGYVWYISQTGNTMVKMGSSTATAYFEDGRVATFSSYNNHYYISKMTYADKSEISYTYTATGNRKRINTLSFGEDRTVTFSYSSASDIKFVYEAGTKYSIGTKLLGINVKCGNDTIRTYTIIYNGQQVTSPIKTIRMSVDFLNSVPPLNFSYYTGDAGQVYVSTTTTLGSGYGYSDPSNLAVTSGKVVYGTEDDGVLMFPNRKPYKETSTCFQNDYNTYTDTIIGSSPFSSNYYHFMRETQNGFVDAFALDVDGASGDEVVIVNNIINGDNDIVTLRAYKTTGILNQPQLWYTLSDTISSVHGNYHSVRPHTILAGDFDGDGRAEVMMAYNSNVLSNTEQAMLKIFSPARNKVDSYNIDAFNVYYHHDGMSSEDNKQRIQESEKIFAIDYDGDGKTELVIVRNSGAKLYQFSYQNGQLHKIERVVTGLPAFNTVKEFDFRVGDFNGDGLGDVMVVPAWGDGNKTMRVYLSKGDCSFLAVSNTYKSKNYYAYYVQDVDDDGQSDLVGINNIDSPYWCEVNLVHNGVIASNPAMSFQRQSATVIVPAQLSNSTNEQIMMSYDANRSITMYRYGQPASVKHLISSMTDSYKNKNEIEYLQLYTSDTYTPGNEATFPYVDYAGGLRVCHTLRKRDSTGAVYEKNTYSYHEAEVHRQGLGFSGFSRIWEHDSVTGHITVATYDPENFGSMTTLENYKERHRFEYDVTVTSNRRIQSVLGLHVLYDKATGTTDSTICDYNNYGYPILSIRYLSDGWTERKDLLYLNYANPLTNTVYHLGLPIHESLATTHDGQSITTGTITNYNTHGWETSRRSYYGNQSNVVDWKTTSYDSDGNVATESFKRYSSTVQLTRGYTYSGTSHKMPTSMTDEYGTVTSYTYGKYGVTQKSNYIMTRYDYDIWGQQISLTRSDSISEQRSVHWSADTIPGIYYVYEHKIGQPDVRKYYNSRHQLITTHTDRYNATRIKEDRTYDSCGRLTSITSPYQTSAQSSFYYTYDEFDRPLTVTYPDLHTDSHGYSGQTTTSIVDGVQSTRTVDSKGNVIGTSDGQATVTYAYRPDCQPYTVSVNGTITTSFSYDSYGRQISINDPSAGTRTRTYDSSGNVSLETDAEGRTIATTYDIHGHPLTRNFNGRQSVTYSYNTVGKLVSMNDDAGHSITNTYDAFYRLSDIDIDGYKRHYTYKWGNVVKNILYSIGLDTIGTESHVYSNGTLTQMKWNNTEVIWRLDSENAAGLPVDVTTASVSQQYLYDAMRRMIGQMCFNEANESVQDLEYDYSATTGNLTFRADNILDTYETFAYDSLNRLTTFGSETATYDSKGNLTGKSDIGGTYRYFGQKPYQMRSLTMVNNDMIPVNDLNIVFNAMQQPDSIRQNRKLATFSYYGTGQRASMHITDSLSLFTLDVSYYDQSYNHIVKTTVTGQTHTKDILYLGGTPYSAPVALVRQNGGSWYMYVLLRDHLGSITHIIDSEGDVVQELSYDAWGNLRDPETLELFEYDEQPELFLLRGYTGHEHLTWFGLINMNARLYEPLSGRFLSPDPLVQSPDNPQNYNRYTYCMNNPLKYIDNDGKVFFLVPIIVGAAIGAVFSATMYSISALISGNWNLRDFGKSLGMGALSGAIGGAAGMIGSSTLHAFGNTLGYNILSQSVNAVISNVVFGQNIQFKDILGVVAGGLVGAFIPHFNPIKGAKPIVNTFAETGFNSMRGAAMGAAHGLILSIYDNDYNQLWRNAIGGAISGGSRSLGMNLLFGAPYSCENHPNVLYRSGGIAGFFFGSGSGLTIGRQAFIGSKSDLSTMDHEAVHVTQINRMGWGAFYATILNEYYHYTFDQGPLEWEAFGCSQEYIDILTKTNRIR